MAWISSDGRICPLFTNDLRIPNLDVAGSNPVSRSNFDRSIKQLFLRHLFELVVPPNFVYH